MPNFAKNLILGPWVIAIPPLVLRAGGKYKQEINEASYKKQKSKWTKVNKYTNIYTVPKPAMFLRHIRPQTCIGYMQKVKIKDHLVHKLEWKQADRRMDRWTNKRTDGQTEVTALPTMLTQSVKHCCESKFVYISLIDMWWWHVSEIMHQKKNTIWLTFLSKSSKFA